MPAICHYGSPAEAYLLSRQNTQMMFHQDNRRLKYAP